MPGALIASLFVGATIVFELLVLHGATGGDQTRNAAITVLGTVITFFAVSTLAVSVSLSLLQTAAQMWPSRIMDIFTEDHDRAILLQTIYMAFLVSLVNLALLTAGLVHPLLALALPILLAFLTLMLMVGYVFERVRLFSSRGLIHEIDRRAKHQFELLRDSQADPTPPRLQTISRVSDIFAVARALNKDGREDDALSALRDGLRLMGGLLEVLDAFHGDRWSVREDRFGAPTDWERDLRSALREARLLSADLASVDERAAVRYHDWVNATLWRLSHAALFDLGWGYLCADECPAGENQTTKTDKRVTVPLALLGTLAGRLQASAAEAGLGQDRMTDVYDHIAEDAGRYAGRLAQGLTGDDNYEPVEGAIFVVEDHFSPVVLALPSFARLNARLQEWRADLSSEQIEAIHFSGHPAWRRDDLSPEGSRCPSDGSHSTVGSAGCWYLRSQAPKSV